MPYFGDPPAIYYYSTTFLSTTRRLLSSRDELAREVQAGASPLSRFTSLSGLASSQPKQTVWPKEHLRSLCDQARRVRVRRNDLTKKFLDERDHPHYSMEHLGRWKEYQDSRERRHYWGQALCCNYGWGSGLSSSLKPLFRRWNADVPPIRSSKAQGDGWHMNTSYSHVPGVMTVKYRTAAGEIRHKTFRADPSLEDATARNHALDDSTPLSSTPEGPVAGSSSAKSRLEYKSVLEYREINRHARRKIEAWLFDGWSVEWEWNRLYDELRKVDDIWRYDGEPRPVHQMTLRRSDENLPSSPTPSNERIVLEFPTTPKSPWDSNSDWLPDPDSK